MDNSPQSHNLRMDEMDEIFPMIRGCGWMRINLFVAIGGRR